MLPVLVMALSQASNAANDKERRIALVIGIGAYQNAPHLNNPVNDARAIGDSLRRLNFDVTELYDADFRALSSGIRTFGIQAATADVALIYYAGHGVQVDRENYLLPADAKLERERDLVYEAMPLERLLGEVSQASHVGIVLLDSCRNNPFTERVSRSMTIAGRGVATTPGLARVDNVPRNTMVVMAAKADQVAEDGVKHSPFADALLTELQIPGVELSLFFRLVRDKVLHATSNRQEPFVFSSLGADPFYFFPQPPNRPPEIGTIKPLEVTESAAPTSLGIPEPTDPDQDPLTVRIIGLPRFGELRIDGKPAAMNSLILANRIKSATYKPDGKTLGSAGTFDILVEDGRGGSITASVPITVRSSHHPPVLAGPGHVQVIQQVLGIPAPVSPDGDPLTVTITALPRGTVRNGTAILHPGDHVTPEELSKLTFWAESNFTGPAGSLRYSVDNGHGGIVDGSIDVEVGTTSLASNTGADTALWENLRNSTDPADFDAFIRFFPASRYADDARHRRMQLKDAAASDKTHAPPKPEPAQAAPIIATTGAPVAKPTEVAEAAPVVTSSNVSPSTSPRVMTAANGPPLVNIPHREPINDNVGPIRFQDCPSCPWIIRIQAGSFMMGQGAREPESLPAHRVDVHAFGLGETPITVADWKACQAAKACSFLPRMRVAEDRTPVHNVSWEDIGQYIAWLSNVAGHSYRLPTEAEWEYAARGGTTTRYWWGDSVGMYLANCTDCGGNQNKFGPLPVDALQPNPFGLYDMLGGVAQWTADCWFPNYRGAPADAAARDAKNCEKRVLRGGSFRDGHDEITTSYRNNYDSGVRYIVNGFRVARDLE